MPKPNVVVCMCDQLRAFEVGCYGNPVVQTPNIDRLAGQGVRFEHAIANNPVCMPSRSSLISGQYSRTCVGRLGNYTEQTASGQTILPEYPSQERRELLDPTIAECFHDLGYDTALIGKWHIQPAPSLVGFDYSLYPRVHHRHTGQHFIENDGPEFLVEGYSLDYEAEAVDRYLGEHGRDPFFLFYNISPPHMPLLDAPEQYRTRYSSSDVLLRPNVYIDSQMAYDEHWFKVYLWDFLYYQERMAHTASLPDGFDLRSLVALYNGMVTWVDEMVGRLMASLENHGLSDDTIVVFVSDHGDNLGSHHRFNKGLLIEESIRIPLIFHAPMLLSPQENDGQIAQIIDVMPTLLALCGGEKLGHVQGRDLSPILVGEDQSFVENWAFVETHDGAIGIRTTDYTVGMQLAGDGRAIADDRTCCYDLRADPYQQQNLAKVEDDREPIQHLREQLRAWHETTPRFRVKE